MSLDISSAFRLTSQGQLLHPQRRFTMGGSDYSDSVVRWPSLRSKATSIDLGSTEILLDNTTGGCRFLIDSADTHNLSCEISVGLETAVNCREYLSLFTGAPSYLRTSRQGAQIRLQLQGKTRQLTDIALGSDATSAGLDYTGSRYLPADLTWELLTNLGGLSATESTSNPDIDYAAWLDWQEMDRMRDARVRGYFTGQKIYQVINDLALMANRSISFRNNRLRFSDQFLTQSMTQTPLEPEKVLDIEFSLNPQGILNDYQVELAFDPAAGTFAQQYSRADFASQAQYGTRSGRFASRQVWFDEYADPYQLVEDQLGAQGTPTLMATVRTPLAGGLTLTPGDQVTLTHSLVGQNQAPFRIVEQEINLDQGVILMRLSQARYRPWEHQAMVSSHNVYTNTLRRLPDGTLVGISEHSIYPRFMRADSHGNLHDMPVYASAFLALDANTILLGGIPDSSGFYVAMQRSSDGGSSSVVVTSLNLALGSVLDIFQVKSGTCLASINSGGILRSTDNGSSWALTQTISAGYQISRFISPRSGTIWGGTGYNNFSTGQGLYIWESLDEGVSWVARHQVYSSGSYVAAEIIPTADSEFLLSHYGDVSLEKGIARSKTLSPASMAWIKVLSDDNIGSPVAFSSSHLLGGHQEYIGLTGGGLSRSLDMGSSWIRETQLGKAGNIALFQNSDGSVDAYRTRAVPGGRLDHFRNLNPDSLL